jgi:hypothetical protein
LKTSKTAKSGRYKRSNKGRRFLTHANNGSQSDRKIRGMDFVNLSTLKMMEKSVLEKTFNEKSTASGMNNELSLATDDQDEEFKDEILMGKKKRLKKIKI